MLLMYVEIGQKFFIRTPMNDGFGLEEMRETHYIKLGHNDLDNCKVKVARYRTIQGVAGEKPRYDPGHYYCVDPGILDIRLDAHLVEHSQFKYVLEENDA